MSVQKSQVLKRKLSARRQLAIPQEFTNESVEAYFIEIDGQDEDGNPILKMYPETEQSSN